MPPEGLCTPARLPLLPVLHDTAERATVPSLPRRDGALVDAIGTKRGETYLTPKDRDGPNQSLVSGAHLTVGNRDGWINLSRFKDAAGQ